MRTLASIMTFVMLVPFGGLHAQDSLLWRYTTTEKISFYQVTQLGDLVVLTKEEVVVLDSETGEPRWSRDDLLKPPGGMVVNPGPFPGAAFNPIPSTPWGVVRTNDGIAMIDLRTGETVWDSTAVPLEKVRGHFAVPRHSLVLVYGETSESKRTLVGIDAATGAVRWRQDTLFQKSPKLLRVNSLRSLAGHQPPMVDTDTTIILNISKDGPMRVHSVTGELLWRLDLNKDAPMLTRGYAPMLYSAGILFIPYERKLMAVNTSDGSIIWDRKGNFRSRLTQMELTSYGLVVRGRKPPDEDDPDGPGKDFFVDLLDPETGSSKWPKAFTKVKINTPFLAGDDGIFVTKEEEFVALDLLDGSARKTAEFEFEGGEKPQSSEVSGDHFSIWSGHNVVSLDHAGALQYHSYYKGPGMSFLEKAVVDLVLQLTEKLDKECAKDPKCTSTGWGGSDPSTGERVEKDSLDLRTVEEMLVFPWFNGQVS